MSNIILNSSLIHCDNQVGNFREIVIKKYSDSEQTHSTWLGWKIH